MAMGLASGKSRGRGRSSRRAPMAEINVTPFVDVMLVLLIIFMVTAPLMMSGVPVDLPDSRANALEQEPDQITIALDSEGFIYIDDVLVEQGQLPLALDSVSGPPGAEQPLVTLRADRALDWGRVMAVMGELNRSGFTAISLVSNSSAEAP
jgi:biopolymer transport protein TolR